MKFWRSPDFLIYWLPPLALGGLILLMSGDLGSSGLSVSILGWVLSWFPPIPSALFWALHAYLRKAGHALAYALLYFLWFRAFRGHLQHGAARSFFSALGVCLLVAAADEGRQYLVDSRTGSVLDVALDLAGALLAALLTFGVWTPRPRREPVAGI